jgi:hypothetical protein
LITSTAPVVAIVISLLFAGPSTATPQTTVRNIEIEGTAFRVTLTDGRMLAQHELVGMRLVLGDGSGQQRQIRIDAVERDAKDAAGEIVLYGFSEQDPATGEWHNICEPDAEGRRLGFPLAGAFTPSGQHVALAGRFFITCTGGAEGKCVRFGYKPWRQAPDGASLAAYYQTCVRLVRADYCGDGVGHTQNGTPIDIFDKIGIQRDETAPGMTFEAAWGPDGAVCVRRTRLTEVLGLAALINRCPRLAGRAGETCDETIPALLFNRSFGR